MSNSSEKSFEVAISLGFTQKVPVTVCFGRFLCRIGEGHYAYDRAMLKIGKVRYTICLSEAERLVKLAKGEERKGFISFTVEPVDKLYHDNLDLDMVYGADFLSVHIKSLPVPLAIPTDEFLEEAEKLLKLFKEFTSVPSTYSML